MRENRDLNTKLAFKNGHFGSGALSLILESTITFRIRNVDGDFGIKRLLHWSVQSMLEHVQNASLRYNREQYWLERKRKMFENSYIPEQHPLYEH